MVKDAYDGNYWQARADAFERSGGRCQFCGLDSAEKAVTARQIRPDVTPHPGATDGHHWEAWKYPNGDEVTSDDITALCPTCHEIATELRRFMKKGGDRFEALSMWKESLAEWITKSESKGSAPSSCGTERQDSIPATLQESRWRKLAESAEATEPSQTKNDSQNSTARLASGSWEDRLRSRRELLGR